MADVLEDSADNVFTSLLPQQQVLNVRQWPAFTTVDKMIPRARIAVQHCRSFDVLDTVRSAAFAFERIVCVACCTWFKLEQLP